MGSHSVWVFAMAIRVIAQRPQWPLKSVWRWDSTEYAALWRTVKPTVNAPSAYASKACWAHHPGPAHLCRAARVGSVGPTARCVAPLARKTWPYASGAAATLARG